MDMNGVTREEAVLFLLSLQDQIELVVQHKREEYDQVVASGHGDSFYVKYAPVALARLLVLSAVLKKALTHTFESNKLVTSREESCALLLAL